MHWITSIHPRIQILCNPNVCKSLVRNINRPNIHLQVDNFRLTATFRAVNQPVNQPSLVLSFSKCSLVVFSGCLFFTCLLFLRYTKRGLHLLFVHLSLFSDNSNLCNPLLVTFVHFLVFLFLEVCKV